MGGLGLRFLCLLSQKWSRDEIEGSGDYEAFLSSLVSRPSVLSEGEVRVGSGQWKRQRLLGQETTEVIILIRGF